MSGNGVTQEVIDTITREVKALGPSIQALGDSTKRELSEMRSIIDEHGKKADALVDERVSKFAASVETKQLALEAGVKAVSDQVEKVEAVLKRPGVAGGWATDEAAKEARNAFDWHRSNMAANGRLAVGAKIEANPDGYREFCNAMGEYMRKREGGLSVAVQNALYTGSDPDGGYTVPTTTSSRVITKVYETSPLRQFATVETIAGKELVLPRDEGEMGYGWIGETTAPTETTTAQFGESKIAAHEMYAEPRATLTMLEDSGLDIEAWVGRKVGERFGRVEAAAFITGTGVNQPRGIMSYASGTTNGTIEQISSGAAAAVVADGLYNLVFALKDFYTANARFMMKRTTVRDVLKLKDGDGQYMWQMGDIKSGVPATLLGYPVVRAEDVAAVEANALAIAFGDFAAAYTVVDRLGMSMIRDNLTAKPYVKFYHRRRVGGDVVNFEAVKIQKIAA